MSFMITLGSQSTEALGSPLASCSGFTTQQLMENHCLQRYKPSAHYLLHADVDEYVQATV